MLGIRANKTMKNTIINHINESNASNAANAAAAARRESRTMKRPNLTVPDTNLLEFSERSLNLKPYMVAAKTLRNKTRNNLATLKNNRNEKREIVKTMKLKRILSNEIKADKINRNAKKEQARIKNQENQANFFKAIEEKKIEMAAKEEARLKGMESGIKAMQIKHAHNLELEKERWSDRKKYREWRNDNKIIEKYMEEVRYFDRETISKEEAASRYYKIKYTDDDEHRIIRSLLKEAGSLYKAIRYYEQSYKRGRYVD